MLLHVLTLVILLAIFGFVAHVIATYVPMPSAFRDLIVAVFVIGCAVYVISVLLGMTPWPNFPLAR